jgi:hypothetical protein
MRNMLSLVGRFGTLAVMVMVLLGTAFSQLKTGRVATRSAKIQSAAQTPETPSSPLIGPGTGNLRLREAVDYDGDLKADFSVFRPSDNVWYLNQSTQGFKAANFGLASQDYTTPGDFDGDGKGDIAVWRDSDGSWYRLNSSNGTFTAIHFGTTGDEPVGRDYDGDGKTDLAVVRRSNGQMTWYVLRSSDGGFSATSWGLSTDFTAPGDYDGDGKFDFCVQRPGATSTSQANFYTLFSNGTFTGTAWGISTDLVVPGDYDGDGKTDYAVVREGATPTTSLSWYILRSSNGGFDAYTWGLTGSDLPVQNDYDGDGKTDLAVWRDTDGNFYYLKSDNSGNFVASHWGQSNDYPVASYDTH